MLNYFPFLEFKSFKDQKFNVMDFAKNSPVPLFWCGISIFKTICNNIYQQNWKKLNFVIFAFS